MKLFKDEIATAQNKLIYTQLFMNMEITPTNLYNLKFLLILILPIFQPILADPRDFMGMEEEESRNIFLLQLPSQLK